MASVSVILQQHHHQQYLTSCRWWLSFWLFFSGEGLQLHTCIPSNKGINNGPIISCFEGSNFVLSHALDNCTI
jgi:hypothetical protein